MTGHLSRWALGLCVGLRRAATLRPPAVIHVHAISDLHVDHGSNLDYVKALGRPAGDGAHALVVAGDVSSDLARLREALESLRVHYDHVFVCPGNHEAWLGPERRCPHRCLDPHGACALAWGRAAR